jgi:hypothetical protein
MTLPLAPAAAAQCMPNTSSPEIQSIDPDEGTHCAIYSKENCQNRVYIPLREKGEDKLLDRLLFPGLAKVVRMLIGVKCWMRKPTCMVVDVIVDSSGGID